MGAPGRLSAAVTAIAVIAALSACSSGGAESDPIPATAPAPGPSTATVPEPSLPIALDALGAQEIAAPSPGWVLVAFGQAWVTGVDRGLARYDASNGRLLGSTPIRRTCSAPDDGFDAMWVPTCRPGTIVRVDPVSGQVTGRVELALSPDGESSIGAGAGAVWAVADDGACEGCLIVAIDPVSLEVRAQAAIPAGGKTVRAGIGGVWIGYPDKNRVVRVDPLTLTVAERIRVIGGPRFMDLGEGAVWVLSEQTGTVTRIDPRRRRVAATIRVDDFGIVGGDLTVGEGAVWVRATDELVARIDPATNELTARIGGAAGGGSASAGGGSLWATAPDITTVYRIPLAAIPTP